MLSLVIPVYNNEESVPRLFQELEQLGGHLADQFEVVFVVDGATDRSLQRLREHIRGWSIPSQLVELSRNFGSFAAIVAGLQQARGDYVAVMAADLQEPPELVLEFHRILTRREA